jgi:sugar/nucleoside kinase (ribokinase family)
MEEAICFATAVSAITVSRPGASVSIPTRTEVEEFLKNQK